MDQLNSLGRVGGREEGACGWAHGEAVRYMDRLDQYRGAPSQVYQVSHRAMLESNTLVTAESIGFRHLLIPVLPSILAHM